MAGLNHAKGTHQAISEIKQIGAQVALSNPCFEVWLLLHHRDVAATPPFETCKAVGAALREALGAYSKRRLDMSQFGQDKRRLAVSRARELAQHDDGYRPANPGSQVYRILESLFADFDDRALI